MAKTPAERKRDQRLREKAELQKKGGRRLSILVYGNTLAELEAVCMEKGFVGQQRLGEAVTYLAHNRK